MQKHKRLLLAVGAPVALAGAGLAVYQVWPRSPLNRETYAKIQQGMTAREVEAIYGLPAGDYSTKELVPALRTLDPGLVKALCRGTNAVEVRRWTGNAGHAIFLFDQYGCVTYMYYWHAQPVPYRSEPFRARLRRWLGWLGL